MHMSRMQRQQINATNMYMHDIDISGTQLCSESGKWYLFLNELELHGDTENYALGAGAGAGEEERERRRRAGEVARSSPATLGMGLGREAIEAIPHMFLPFWIRT
jgi:hypothetical protein